MAGILIHSAVEQGELRAEFWELVTVARQLAPSVGGGLRVALAGSQLGDALEQARRAGAAEVRVLEHAQLADPWPEGHFEALAALCGRLDPEVVLVPRTPLGAEVAARLAIRRGASLVHDVTHVQKGADGITATRPVFGGAVSATVQARRGPWVIVPRPHAFAAAAPADGEASPVVREAFAPATPPRTFCGARTRQGSSGAKDIEKARVLVSGGAGLGGPEPFRLLGEVAELLGGAVAASRVAVDAGWVPTSLQVGLTGRSVAPDLYLAVGISGATHHLAGCSSAQVIAVVNSDPAAPFFRLANYGVVGDWKEVIPAFRDALKEKLATSRVA
ncbi:MAG TPA: electron transfer flavoprotein subunit alpha/FixB family protein [Anaeromyxobacter sp.]